MAKRTSRDEELGEIARRFVELSGLGHPLFLRNERIVAQRRVNVVLPHVREGDKTFELYLTATTADAHPLDHHVSPGRVVLSTDPGLYEVVAGAYAFTRKVDGRRCIHALWTMPSWRGRGLGRIIGEELRRTGVTCGLPPASSSARAWLAAMGFQLLDDTGACGRVAGSRPRSRR